LLPFYKQSGLGRASNVDSPVLAVVGAVVPGWRVELLAPCTPPGAGRGSPQSLAACQTAA